MIESGGTPTTVAFTNVNTVVAIHFQECNPCPAGKFAIAGADGTSRSTSCQDCPAGSYGEKVGA